MILSGPRFLKQRRVLRVTIIALLFLVLAFIVTTILVGRHYKRLLREQLPGAVSQATEGLYKVSFDDVDVNLFTRHLTIEGIHLWPDSAKLTELVSGGHSPAYVGTLTIPEVQVQGGSVRGKKGARAITLGRLWIGEPVINLTILERDSLNFTKALQHTPELSSLHIQSMEIEEPVFNINWQRGERKWKGGFSGGNIDVTDILYEPSASTRDISRYYGAGNIAATFNNLFWDQEEGWYRVRSGSVSFSTEGRMLEAKQLDIEPAMSKDSLYAEIGSQTDIYECHLPKLEVLGIAWRKLLYDFSFSTEKMRMHNPDLSVYFSRVPPKNLESRQGRFPQQLLMKLPVPVDVPVTDLIDGKFTYTELNNKTMVPASIGFTTMNGFITNLTNQPLNNPANPWCTISLHGKFQQRSDIVARIRFHLLSPHAGFTLESRLGAMEGAQISNQASALALAQIPKMHLQKLDMQIRGDEIYSRGKITILYSNLKVNVQKVDSITKRLHQRPLVSLLANKMLLFPSNPMPGEAPRIANTFVERDDTKSFFSLIWRNLFEAAVQTALHDEGMKEVLKNTKARKAYKAQYGKKRFFKDLFPKREKAEKNSRK